MHFFGGPACAGQVSERARDALKHRGLIAFPLAHFGGVLRANEAYRARFGAYFSVILWSTVPQSHSGFLGVGSAAGRWGRAVDSIA